MAERGWPLETVEETPFIELPRRSVNHSRGMGVRRGGERFYSLCRLVRTLSEEGQRR
jgi:hypothetical protein